jgi:hypothetical protein
MSPANLQGSATAASRCCWQGLAIVDFAARHSETRIALFLTIYLGNKADFAKFKSSVFVDALKSGVLIFVLSAK